MGTMGSSDGIGEQTTQFAEEFERLLDGEEKQATDAEFGGIETENVDESSAAAELADVAFLRCELAVVDDLENHLVLCPHEGCGKSIRAIELGIHRTECEHRPASVVIDELGQSEHEAYVGESPTVIGKTTGDRVVEELSESGQEDQVPQEPYADAP